MNEEDRRSINRFPGVYSDEPNPMFPAGTVYTHVVTAAGVGVSRAVSEGTMLNQSALLS